MDEEVFLSWLKRRKPSKKHWAYPLWCKYLAGKISNKELIGLTKTNQLKLPLKLSAK